MSNEWFERGELPPVGAFVEYVKIDGIDMSGLTAATWSSGDKMEVLAHRVVCGDLFPVFFNLDEEQASCLISKCYRPIRTGREKAIEAAVRVISGEFDGVLAHVFNAPKDAAEKLYDAGLLRLPEDKK